MRIADYATTHDPAFVTRDGRSTFALVYTAAGDGFGGSSDLEPGDAAARCRGRARRAGTSGSPARSCCANGRPQSARKGTSIMVEAMIGGLGALVILAFVFASFLALLPLLIGGDLGAGHVPARRAASPRSPASARSSSSSSRLIGLGVAIDYSLLVVSRWREERAARPGQRSPPSTEAMTHAGRAVVFSGLTVAIGLLSMIVLPVPMLRSVGYGGVLVPLVSVAVAVTLLPVILATVGPRLDWPRLRTERRASRVFSAWARGVYRHRWLAALAGPASSAALMLPALSLHLGEPDSTSQATSGPAHDALATLTDGGVPSGVLTPAEVLTYWRRHGAVAAQPAQRARRLRRGAPPPPDYHRAGTAIVTVSRPPRAAPGAGQATVARRASTRCWPNPHVIGVGGDGASLIDFDHAVYGNFPLMLALIGIATFLLLTRAFRSVLLAAKAVVFNLVSLAAAYGVLTWVWQDGHGTHAMWGIPATGRDHHVGAADGVRLPVRPVDGLRGVHPHPHPGGLRRHRLDAAHAVIEGLGRTGRLVTSAALILMLSFLSMSTGPQTDLKILATGLGAGILVDAVVVRACSSRPWSPCSAVELVAAGPAGPAAASAPSPAGGALAPPPRVLERGVAAPAHTGPVSTAESVFAVAAVRLRRAPPWRTRRARACQPSWLPTMSRWRSQPSPCASSLLCSSTTRVRFGPSAVNVTATSLALPGSRLDLNWLVMSQLNTRRFGGSYARTRAQWHSPPSVARS